MCPVMVDVWVRQWVDEVWAGVVRGMSKSSMIGGGESGM
jgi:hypothetical protein